MQEEEKINEIKDKIKGFKDNATKIDFLENYLTNGNEKLEIKVLAEIYSHLGDLKHSVGQPRASYYQKAASTWETVSVLSKDANMERDALRKALENYRKALKIYKREQNFALTKEIENKMQEVKGLFYKQIGPMKKLTILSVMLIFVFSFLLLSSSLTGYTVIDTEANDPTFTGIILATIGLFAMLLVLRWWK